MTDLVIERLPGCNADSLDAYLRGLGFFLLAGQIEPSVRAWWDKDDLLWIASRVELDELSRRVNDWITEGGASPVATPWRGNQAKGGFIQLRNECDEGFLSWFDACSVPRPPKRLERKPSIPSGPLGEKENNPLLGEGGGYGNTRLEAAQKKALERIRTAGADVSVRGIVALLLGEARAEVETRRVSIKGLAPLTVYQSGRGTGPGSSAVDRPPTEQRAHTQVNAWDVLLLLEALRLFRGAPTRRYESATAVQSSFPLVVRARPIGTDTVGSLNLRSDGADTFEFLAPLWPQPCTARTLGHLIGKARIRTRRGVAATDTIDAALVQAGNDIRDFGFDRLVRFALLPAGDQGRQAVKRGIVMARGLMAARHALEDVVSFLRDVERDIPKDDATRPTGFRLAMRRQEDALVALAQPCPRAHAEYQHPDEKKAQKILIALSILQPYAGRTCPTLAAPRLSTSWFKLTDDRSPEYRLARALVGRLATEQACLLRTVLLPQRENDHGRWILDPAVAPPDLERVSEPLASLASAALLALRRSRGEDLHPSGVARLRDLALLLSGALASGGEQRLALLAATLAGVQPARYEPRSTAIDPRLVGLDSATARLLLACQPSQDEGVGDPAVFERAEELAALVLRGNLSAAHVAADRELRRRQLDLLPLPLLRAADAAASARLALACLLPLDEMTRDALGRLISVTPTHAFEGGLA